MESKMATRPAGRLISRPAQRRAAAQLGFGGGVNGTAGVHDRRSRDASCCELIGRCSGAGVPVAADGGALWGLFPAR